MNQIHNIPHLKREIDNWISILEIWKNHISFLGIRLRSREEKKGEIANTYLDLYQQISFLADSVIPDYLDSFQHHNADLEAQDESALEAAWLEEHHLYQRHLRQLRSEYKQLAHKILTALEKNNRTNNTENERPAN